MKDKIKNKLLSLEELLNKYPELNIDISLSQETNEIMQLKIVNIGIKNRRKIKYNFF
jgi:hypothetical protein